MALAESTNFVEGQKVWYKSSSGARRQRLCSVCSPSRKSEVQSTSLHALPLLPGEEVKGRVTKAAGCLDLNIREEADPARVRPRDDAGDASDVRPRPAARLPSRVLTPPRARAGRRVRPPAGLLRG